MNKHLVFIVIATTLLASVAIADCETSTSEETITDQLELTTDVPKHLEGATITVRLKDGKESIVPAEKFKVVPRAQQFIVTKTNQQSLGFCTVKDPHKNRISLLGGRGPKAGVDRTNNPTNVEVESREGTIGGAQYQRLLTEKLSVGAQVQSNDSVLVNVGLDF